MKKIIFLSCLISITSLISGCGGSGGDGDDAQNVSGTWKGALTKISDTCNPSGPATINISHQVNQNEDAVNLQAESGVIFIGNTVGQDAFSVDGSHSTAGLAGCSDQTRIEYRNINDEDDPTADVEININRTCGASSCTIQYTGTVSRTTIPGTPDNVSPTPVPGVTPVSGGCAAINPNPANDSYEGDGGCGISDTVFSFQSNVVVLEPFGSNGLTSFNVDATNPSVATSQSNNLTVDNQTGASCSIICSPPSTFTVRCTKEGGVSCVEKF